MAQNDSKYFFGPSAQIPTAAVEVHLPAGQGPTNNPTDNPNVPVTHAGFTSSGNPVKATQITIAGNVRLSNPS
jgi:hypothetical protein